MANGQPTAYLPAFGLPGRSQRELPIKPTPWWRWSSCCSVALCHRRRADRWPAVHWLEADTFYQVLMAHGIDMLIFWIIFSKSPFYFCSSACCYAVDWQRPNWRGLRLR